MTRQWLLAMVGASAFLASCSKESAPPPTAPAATAATPAEEAAPVAPVAAEEAEPLDVASQWMPYGEGKDALIRGYFAYPESMVAPLPAIIVVHDWRGLDEPTKQMADRLASRGYMVLAVDFFGGKVASSAEEAAALSRGLLEQTEAADQNVVAAYRFLTDAAGAPSVATLGTAMGGYWAVKSMRLLPGELKAAVNWYGQVDEDPALIEQMDAPLLGLFAGSDRSMPPQRVRDFRAAAESAGKTVDVQIIPNVSAGFANPDDPRFDQQAADLAWQRTMNFLTQHLTAI